MAANDTLGLNQSFQIYHENGSAYEGLVMHKAATDSVVMSLGDSISGDVYWHDNELQLTLKEYITYNGVNYVLVNPPTIVREGMVADNSELKGMTKYSFKFYHPMYQLGNIPFSDVAVTNDQKKYLSENKVFSWIGTANDFLAKLNKNLDGTQWMVEMSSNFPNDKKTEMSDVLAFDKNSVADALKTAYDTWGVPYVIDVTTGRETGYTSNKHFKVVWGLPSNEIYENATKKQQNLPYIFKMGKGVGLKNNSRTPRNNKIITRIAGYGSETNIPYGYPQIVWTGNQSWNYTIQNNPNAANSYPIYDGIVGGQKVRLIKHPFTRPHLMPTVYVNSVNKKVNPNASGYRANTVLVDYYDATAADHYPNPINLQAPSYDIHEFEDIKPELGSVAITAVTPLNPDLTPASSWDDTMDDDGNFVQSYFMVTLPVLSFDIYACAAITEAMEINMRSGDCLGCTFPVEVDWEDYKANFYNEDGEFDPVIHSAEGDGHVRNGRKYPNSASTTVTLILKKENTTFGTLMPNTYQHPHSGDKFVVLGISLPTSYITSAQTRLDEAMKSYMLENNVHYYDYPLKFDEAFLRNNTYILSQLKPNAIVRFEFAGETMPLYVKQMNVKFGEGVLPKYDITLTDNVEVVLNQIGQVADDVEKLSSLLSLLRQSYDSNVWVALAKKLSKTDDDTAQGFIRFVKGLQVGERFDSGLLGEGGVFRKDADGTTYIEADKLYIRMKAYFDTVEIRKYMHSGGNRIASPAGAKCVRVENMAWYPVEGKFVPVDEYGTYRKKDINDEEYVVATGLPIVRYRCYFRGEDNDGDKVTNDFIVGDQAYCHITNGDTASLLMHHYWRLVVAKNQNGSLTEDGEFWIDLANYVDEYGQPSNVPLVNRLGETVYHKSHQYGSDIPREQDDIVQLGHAFDTTRQGAIIEYSSGENAPSYKIYQGIDDFSFEDTNYISLGYDSGTGRAYMNVYGDFFFGAKPNPRTGESPTFIQYNAETQELKIKAEVEFIHPNEQGEPESTSMVDFANAVKESIEDLQGQIDGEIDTWYYEGVPTLNNLPASEWYDATQEPVYDVRAQHIGDLYYDKANGDAYRFILDTSVTPNEYKWIQLHDDAITEALRLASEAKDTADRKRRVFLTQPVPPYDQGDLWVNATYPANYTGETDESQQKYNNEILKCIVAVPVKDPETGDVTRNSFLISDWSLSNGYTSRFNDFLYNTYAPFISNIQGQVDQKAETWYQDSNPATAWYDATQDPVYDVRAQHVGDIWMDTSANGGKQTYIYQYNTSTANYEWKSQAVPDEVFDYADGKCAIYVNNPTSTQNPYPTNYHERDMWVLPIEVGHDTYTIGGVVFKAGEVLFSSADSTSFVAAHWSKKLRYTGDERIDGFINQILNGTGASGNDATVANAINAVTGALNASPTLINGGLVLTTLIGMRDGNNNVWSGISGLYKTAETGTGYKGHGIAAWYGGGMQDWEVYLETLTPTQQQSATITDAYAKSLFRFDGSGYLAGGNITWDKNGSIIIKNITTLSDSQNTNLLNELATFNSAFSFSTSQGSGGAITVLSITPNVSFTSLSILDNGTPRPVATQKWVEDNFVSISFFNALFTAYSDSAHTNSINPKTWTAQTLIDNLKVMVGVWTNQYVSALGQNSQQGGGGGIGDVTWDLLANNSDTHPIALSHITTALSSYGTATQNWVSTQGYLTEIPTASSSVKGGIKVGTTLAISSAILDLASIAIAIPASGDTTYTKVYVDGYGRVTKATTLAASDIPNLSDTYASVGDVETLQGYFTNGVANTAAKLNTGNSTYSVWGQTFFENGTPVGIPTTAVPKMPYILFRNYNDDNAAGHVGRGSSGNNGIQLSCYTASAVTIENAVSSIVLGSDGRVGIGYMSNDYNIKLTVDGNILARGSSAFIQIGDIRLVYDQQNNSIKVVKSDNTAANFYATGAVSALGSNSQQGGTGVTLNQPLSAINSAGLGAPSAAGSAIVWNGSSWTYSRNSNLMAASLSSLGSITAYNGGFAVSGKNDNYILTAGGGTKLFKLAIDSASLEDGQALVYDESTSSWVNGEGGGFEMKSVTNATLKGLSGTFGFYGQNLPDNDTRNYDWVGIQVGTTNDKWQLMAESGHLMVRQNDAGGSSSTGWVPVSSVESSGWYTVLDSGNYKSVIGNTYSTEDTKDTAGNVDIHGVNGAAMALYLVGADSYSGDSGSYSVTHVNHSCYVGTNNCLYSNGSKVMTITANDMNAAINTLSEGISDPVGDDYYVAQYAGGGTTTTTYHRRKVSSLANYIRSTISGSYWTKTEITELKSYTSVQSLGWGNITDDAKKVVTSNALAYWNGRYNSSSSNLAYCVKGEFGNIVTKNITDFIGLRNINGTYGSSTDPLNNLTGSFAFYGNYLINGQYDWVGLQVSNDGADRGQIVWSDGTLLVRQQDDWLTWTSWATVLTSNNYSSYDTKNTTGAYQKQSTNLYLVGTESSNQEYAVTNINSSVYINSDNTLCAPKFDTVSSNSRGFYHRLSTNSSGNGGLAVENDSQGINSFFVWINYNKEVILGSESFNANTYIYGNHVGIGTSSPGDYKLYVDGTGYFNSTLRINAGIEAPNGDGLLVYAPASGWTGISSSQWGLGCVSKQGVIRSNNTDLIHYKNGTSYTILDTTNGVTLDTTQDISGAKSFTSNICCKKSNASIYVCQMSGASEVKKVGLNSDNNRGVWDFSYGAWLIGNNGTNTFLNVGNVGIGTSSPSQKLDVNGYTKTTRLYLSDTIYLKVENNAVHVVGGGLYTDTYVSAFGQNSSSSGGVGDVTWSALATAVSSGTQQIDASHISAALGTCVKTTGTQNIYGDKTFMNGLSVQGNISCDNNVSGNKASFNEITTVGGQVSILHVGAAVNDTTYYLYVNGGNSYFSKKICIGASQVYLEKLSRYSGYDALNIVAAEVAFNGNTIHSSDERLKDIHEYVNTDISNIADAPVFNYSWKKNPEYGWHLGSSANYWQKIFGYAVTMSVDGYLGMDYSSIALASAVITARKVLDHEGRIRLLEVENQALRQEIEQLKKAA